MQRIPTFFNKNRYTRPYASKAQPSRVKKAFPNNNRLQACMRTATQQTRLNCKHPVSVGLFYGYELSLLSSLEKHNPIIDSSLQVERMSWPLVTKRHYFHFGYHPDVPKIQAYSMAAVFLTSLLYQLEQHYPSLYQQIKYCNIHKDRYFTPLNPNKKLPDLEAIHSVHIDLVALSNTHKTVLEHYANYITTLFGAMTANNSKLPEIRDFELSKMRRNRLFQLYIICAMISRIVIDNLPPLTVEQEQLLKQLFVELRQVNHSELFIPLKTIELPVTDNERNIKNSLIFPRLALMREHMQNDDLVRVTSPAIYDGDEMLEAELSPEYIEEISRLVEKVHNSYPDIVDNYESAPIAHHGL